MLSEPQRLAACRQVRVLIVQMPRVLMDIVEALVQREEDIELVGEVGGSRSELRHAVAANQPDVVLIGYEKDEIQGLAEPLFAVNPSLRFLALAGVGEAAFLYELRPQLVPMGALSPDSLLQAIRNTRVRIK